MKRIQTEKANRIKARIESAKQVERDKDNCLGCGGSGWQSGGRDAIGSWHCQLCGGTGKTKKLDFYLRLREGQICPLKSFKG